jgi:pyruvate kinase
MCQGIMVARGDLGVECPPEDVPLLQKQIIDECRDQGRPVVVATQMLESMIECPTPTRAEASDVATAIYDGADAIMLSAESAAGKYPEESVTMQQRIINRVESDKHYRTYLNQNAPAPEASATDAVITAAREVAKTINAKSIVCFSLRGSTVSRASKMRPSVPILALCPFKETSRQLALSWGVYPDLPKAGTYDSSEYGENNDSDNFDNILRNACRAALKKGLVSDPDDLLVVTAGLPFGTPGAAVRLETQHLTCCDVVPLLNILSCTVFTTEYHPGCPCRRAQLLGWTVPRRLRQRSRLRFSFLIDEIKQKHTHNHSTNNLLVYGTKPMKIVNMRAKTIVCPRGSTARK